jgi:4-diphosphocytidyl-2-C-methyl-D-erythritol kinase
MLVFPNAKINIGLNIIGKRNDGFHNLETVFVPIALKDALEIIPQPNTENEISFSQTGLPCNVADKDNICVKAYQLLKRDFPNLPNIKMHLHKAIPLGAGMGGGSADAAFVIKLLNTQFNLALSSTQQINYAAVLGSDCPFFIHNTISFAKGRGEILAPLQIDLSNYNIYIVNPGIHVNTGMAFSQLQISDRLPEGQLIEAIKKPITEWKEHVFNGFEKPVFAQHSILKKTKQTLYQQGATYASMSGSGSTLYGIFPKETIPLFNFPDNFFCHKV